MATSTVQNPAPQATKEQLLLVGLMAELQADGRMTEDGHYVLRGDDIWVSQEGRDRAEHAR